MRAVSALAVFLHTTSLQSFRVIFRVESSRPPTGQAVWICSFVVSPTASFLLTGLDSSGSHLRVFSFFNFSCHRWLLVCCSGVTQGALHSDGWMILGMFYRGWLGTLSSELPRLQKAANGIRAALVAFLPAATAVLI